MLEVPLLRERKRRAGHVAFSGWTLVLRVEGTRTFSMGSFERIRLCAFLRPGSVCVEWPQFHDMKTMKHIKSPKDGHFLFRNAAAGITGSALVMFALASLPSDSYADEAADEPPKAPTVADSNPLEGTFEAQGSPLQPKKGARTAGEPEAEEPRPAEWFGGELPWYKWSRVTGNWGGLRDALENGGATVAGTYTMDWSAPDWARPTVGLTMRPTRRGSCHRRTASRPRPRRRSPVCAS